MLVIPDNKILPWILHSYHVLTLDEPGWKLYAIYKKKPYYFFQAGKIVRLIPIE